MAAALGFVDDLLPGRNLAGLEQLAEILSGLHSERPARRQHPHQPPVDSRHTGEPGSVRAGPRAIILRPQPWANGYGDWG